MKCPKCGFTGFEHLSHCKKCLQPLREKPQAPAAISAPAPAVAKAVKPQKSPSPPPRSKLGRRPAPSPQVPSSHAVFPNAPTIPPLPDLAEAQSVSTSRGGAATPLQPIQDRLPPLPAITLSPAESKSTPLPQRAPRFDSFSSSVPDSSSLLPPLDFNRAAHPTFANLPTLKVMPARQHQPSSAAPIAATEEKGQALLPPSGHPTLAEGTPAANQSSATPASFETNAEQCWPAAAALAIDLLLAAALFLLLVWAGEKVWLGSGALRGITYGVFLVGVYGGYFALFRRLGWQTPGARLLQRIRGSS
jgi:hypothetical protein